MATAIQEKYHWNEKHFQWERIDHVQQYKGYEIQTVSTHDDNHNYWSYHRHYWVICPTGRTFMWGINKRGGNIKNLKSHIDDIIEREKGLVRILIDNGKTCISPMQAMKWYCWHQIVAAMEKQEKTLSEVTKKMNELQNRNIPNWEYVFLMTFLRKAEHDLIIC